MNFESEGVNQMPKYIDVVTSGDTVTVRNNAIGCALTYRNGIVVFQEGNFKDLTKNNLRAMAQYAANALTKKAA